MGFDLSASDLIRTIWAYMHGLLEVARVEPTQHPGMLIFDEPRQQSADKLRFSSLMKRASTAAELGQQVIFATSEERANLKKALEGLPYTFHTFEGGS